jgi:putative heme-binding domain-containing protein
LNNNDNLGLALYRFIQDADPQVRLQLAYSLGEWKSPLAGKALGQLLATNAADKYMVAAVMSSVGPIHWEALLQEVQAHYRGRGLPGALLQPLLRMVQVHGSARGTAMLLAAVADPDRGQFSSDQFFTLSGLLDALQERNSSLATLYKDGDTELKNALFNLGKLFAAARRTALDAKAPLGDRAMAARLLGRGLDRQTEDIKTLAGLLAPQQADDLQSAAVQSLGRLAQPEVPRLLLSGWKSQAPALRNQVLDVLLGRPEGTAALLGALEKKEILGLEIDAIRRQGLLEHKNPGIRARAAKAFGGAVDPDRAKVVESYRKVLALQGDTKRGQKVFMKSCAACHQLSGLGQQGGPDLASVKDKTPEGLLVAILDPNRAVEARYVGYVATTKAGVSLSGLLAAETSTSITLASADGKKHAILRTDLEELSSTGKSAMPEGLEKEIAPQEMADLLAFIRSSVVETPRDPLKGASPRSHRALEAPSVAAASCR